MPAAKLTFFKQHSLTNQRRSVWKLLPFFSNWPSIWS